MISLRFMFNVKPHKNELKWKHGSVSFYHEVANDDETDKTEILSKSILLDWLWKCVKQKMQPNFLIWSIIDLTKHI